VFQGSRQEGSARAFIKTLRLALLVDPSLDLLTVIEDDVTLCKNALTYVMQTAIPPDVALVTWFTFNYDWSVPRHTDADPSPATIARENHRRLWACRPTRFFVLNQTVTFPRRTLDLLLACRRITTDWPKCDGQDEMPSWALGDVPYAAHFPVLVQHTGHLNSAVELTREKNSIPKPVYHVGSSPYYVGRDFDALSLLP
jgi:hypothetical protein